MATASDLPGEKGRWSRGPRWYASLFVTDKRCCGEVSPQYSRDAEENGVPARMASIIPRAKLIYLVREPHQRLVSHYRMEHRNLRTNSTFVEFVEKDRGAVASSCYGSRLREFLRHYPREQVLVVESMELQRRREDCLAGIFSYLGVDPHFRSSRFERESHVGVESIYPNARGRALLGSRPVGFLRRHLSDWSLHHVRNLLLLPFQGTEPSVDLPEEVEAGLRARFREEVALLRELTGQRLASLGA